MIAALVTALVAVGLAALTLARAVRWKADVHGIVPGGAVEALDLPRQNPLKISTLRASAACRAVPPRSQVAELQGFSGLALRMHSRATRRTSAGAYSSTKNSSTARNPLCFKALRLPRRNRKPLVQRSGNSRHRGSAPVAGIAPRPVYATAREGHRND